MTADHPMDTNTRASNGLGIEWGAGGEPRLPAVGAVERTYGERRVTWHESRFGPAGEENLQAPPGRTMPAIR